MTPERSRVALVSENGVTGLSTPSPHAGDARRLLFVGRLVPFGAGLHGRRVRDGAALTFAGGAT